jgi:hypothetical protein
MVSEWVKLKAPALASALVTLKGGCVVGTNETWRRRTCGASKKDLREPDSVLGPGEGAGLLVGKSETEGMADGTFTGDAVGDNVMISCSSSPLTQTAEER